MVDLGDDLDLSLTFWRHLDRAADEMRLYGEALHKPHLTAADLCRRHVAAASERSNPHAAGQPGQSLYLRVPRPVMEGLNILWSVSFGGSSAAAFYPSWPSLPFLP
ncbi:hypothetical protein [Streptomyces sp. NPDC058206]|uniref:hypothetical protein n=1 Tax=Streptomyces sp. NPDC058206 TaxID=3346382 RepID=UPI0036EDBCDE